MMEWKCKYNKITNDVYSKDGATCYQCADTARDGPCDVDLSLMEREFQLYIKEGENFTMADAITSHYLKTCSMLEPYCLIQVIENQGILYFFLNILYSNQNCINFVDKKIKLSIYNLNMIPMLRKTVGATW